MRSMVGRDGTLRVPRGFTVLQAIERQKQIRFEVEKIEKHLTDPVREERYRVDPSAYAEWREKAKRALGYFREEDRQWGVWIAAQREGQGDILAKLRRAREILLDFETQDYEFFEDEQRFMRELDEFFAEEDAARGRRRVRSA